MEQELQIPSCLFGGPPVRDDIIKLGESQIGFINIFARPLFEGVTYLLPAMGFAVEEMSINKSTWDDKIQSTRQQMKENPRLHLGALSSGFAADPSPSPFSGPPLKQVAEVAGATQLRLGPNALGSGNGTTTELTDRRGSNGSIGAHPSTSHNAALGIDKSTSIPGTRSPASLENQSQSRRGSVDPNMTTILITQSPNPTDKSNIDGDADPVARSTPPSRRKDTLPHPPPKKASGKSADEMENGGVRPLTAPSSARRSQGKSPNPHNAYFFRAPRPFGIGPDDDSANNLHPLPHLASQSQSEVDLCHTVNGAADGSKPAQWDATNHTADSHVSRPDTFRDSSRRSEWWRLSSRRRTRDVRNGDTDTGGQQKEVVLDPSMLQANADATSPTSSSPCRNSKTEKLKTFFKRKAKNNDDQEKQLSSFGSSSQLRTPPTSDPGRSVNSDD
jgi:3',5'-cyclic-nucleotide phosphodiesterase